MGWSHASLTVPIPIEKFIVILWRHIVIGFNVVENDVSVLKDHHVFP